MRVSALLTALGLLALSLTATAADMPKIEHWTLDNGVKVYFVRSTELPLVHLRAVFDAASSRDPATKPGVARLTASMLRQGAAGLSADDIATGFESLGAEFSASAERDMAVAQLRSLSEPKLLEPALDLYAKVIGRPTFPEDAFERERARTLVALQHDLQSPAAIVSKTFMHRIYGEHPYAHDPIGTPESVKSIARADLAAHHALYYTGENAWLAIVGNATREEARRISERALGHLPRGKRAPPLPAAPALTKGAHELIPFPSQQSHIRLGKPAIRRDSPDYFPLLVANYTLGGGGLVSRLSTEIREKRGYAYSVYSYFQAMRAQGPFVVGLQTRNAQRDDAIAVVGQVLEEYAAEGPTAEELEAAKRHLTGSFPLQLDSNSDIAGMLAYMAFYGLPLDYLETYPERVRAVTAEQARGALKRHLSPDNLVTVVVGGSD